MEHLSKAHELLAKDRLEEIQRRMDQLQEKGRLEVVNSRSLCEFPNKYLTHVRVVKSSNLFAAKMLCEEILEKLPLEPLEECEHMSELADVLLAMGPLSEALRVAEELYKKSVFHQFKAMEYRAEILLGHIYRATSDIDNSRVHYCKAENLAKESPELSTDKQLLAFIYQQICTYSTGKNGDALSNLLPLVKNDALSKFSKGILLQALGNIFRSAADWRAAETHFEHSIMLANHLGDEPRMFERRAELGRVYRSSGLYKDALERQHQFYEFALSRGDVSSVAAACGYIGFTNYSMNVSDYSKAIAYLTARSELSKRLGDLQGYRWCLNNIGKCYLSLKCNEQAFALFHESAELAKQLNDLLGEGTAYGNLGTACRALGNLNDATKYHELYRKNAQTRLDTGGVAIMQKELALDYVLLKNYEMAKKYAIQALHTGLTIRSNLSQEDDRLKIANFEKNQAKVYSLLQHILVNQGLVKEALLVSEMGRAQALADLLKPKAHKSRFLSTLSHIPDEDGKLNEEAVCYVLMQIRSLLDHLHSSLIVYSIVESPVPGSSSTSEMYLYTWLVQPGTGQDRSEPDLHFHSAPICENQHGASGGAFQLDRHYFGSLMREVGVNEVSFKQASPLRESQVLSSHSNSEQHTGSDTQSILRDIVMVKQEKEKDKGNLSQLYDIMIQPLEKYMPQISATSVPRLIFIPQGFLFNVPFPALKSPTSYLIERFVVSVSTSIHLLHHAFGRVTESALTCQKEPAEAHVLSVGNPKMPLAAIPQLPGAEIEAKMVTTVLGGKLLCGTAATKSEVVKQLPLCNIIHFATHAILGDSLADHLSETNTETACNDGDYSIKGAIILAKSDDSCSGVLTSVELQSINMNSELVVLSCCKSGCGKITGDGILGLSRTIISAGAKCLIVTLWSIHDKPTANLMKHFYTKYKIHRDAAYVLRAAMLQLMREQDSPAYWGAFCIIGVSPNISHVGL